MYVISRKIYLIKNEKKMEDKDMVFVVKQPHYLTTKQLAALVGTTDGNIRYWDDTGKLVAHERTPGGIRYYVPEQVEEARKLVKNTEARRERNILIKNGYIERKGAKKKKNEQDQ